MSIRTESGKKIDPFGRPLFDSPKARALSRVGVVDIGSNSIRMVVFDGAARSPAYFFNEKVMAGLGSGLAATGKLNPEGARRGMQALRRFAALARGMGIEPLTCVATAAVREAEDGPEWRKAVEAETGLKLHVIDGREEARLSTQGVLLGWPDAKGLVCDIGGNSMELAVVSGGEVGARCTSPLGPFRLQMVEGGVKQRAAHIDGVLEDLGEVVGLDHNLIYLVGGSWRAIARLDMERRNYPLPVLHEYRMSPDDCAKTLEWIAETDPEALRRTAGISSSRMELVPIAAEVLSRIIKTFAPDQLAISSYGIREGLLYEQMPDELRFRDPLIEASRHAEAQSSRTPGFGKQLYLFLMPLFEGASPELERLIRAACLLHDTAWRAHPDYRADAVFDFVTRSNMAALSHGERVFIALALVHRYKSSRAQIETRAPLYELLSPAEREAAEVLGRALRFGAMFSVTDPAAVATLVRDREAGTLRLNLVGDGVVLFGEVAQARFSALAKAMGLEPLLPE